MDNFFLKRTFKKDVVGGDGRVSPKMVTKNGDMRDGYAQMVT